MSNSPYQPIPEVPVKASRIKKFSIFLGIILSGFAVLVVLTATAPKPAKKIIVSKAPLVEVVEIEKSDVVFEIESQGSIAPRTETTLISEVSGVVKEVSNKFVVGGFFEKGELLLEIDPISYEVALLQAQARLDGAKAKLVEERAKGKQAEKEWSLTGRAKNNAPILALRKPQLQQAIADVKAAEADVRSAQIKLDRTRITAPYDAMVKAKMVDIGQYVSTGSQLASTFAVDYAEIRLPIKEQDFAYIDVPAMGTVNDVGSRVELSIEQGGVVKNWQTFITRSEGVVDASSRVNYLVAQIDDPYGVLSKNIEKEPIRMGTFVKAKIYGRELPDVMTIPRKAVRGVNELYLVSEDRKLNFAKVNILRSDTNNIYVTEGLDTGDKVVVTKLATAVDGMSLRLPGDTGRVEIEEKNVASQGEDEESAVKVHEESSEQPKKAPQDKGALAEHRGSF